MQIVIGLLMTHLDEMFEIWWKANYPTTDEAIKQIAYYAWCEAWHEGCRQEKYPDPDWKNHD